MIASNVGHYDLKLQAQYMYPDLKTRFENVMVSIVYFKFHLYNSSLCQFTPQAKTSSYSYQIKNTPSLMQI